MEKEIIEKLKKLLALSASDNENEAILAMSKAEQLMRRHNLSIADVAIDGSGAYVESVEIEGLTRSVQKWEQQLGTCIARTFNGQAVCCRLGRGKGWQFTFVAGRTDLAIIVDLYNRLRQTVRRMSADYVHNNPNSFVAPRTLHNSYRVGMTIVIRERLEKFRENTRPDDSFNACGLTGKELIIVKDKAVDQRVGRLFPKLKRSSVRFSSVETSAYSQGRDDGRKVSLHRSVNGSDHPAAIAS